MTATLLKDTYLDNNYNLAIATEAVSEVVEQYLVLHTHLLK